MNIEAFFYLWLFFTAVIWAYILHMDNKINDLLEITQEIKCKIDTEILNKKE